MKRGRAGVPQRVGRPKTAISVFEISRPVERVFIAPYLPLTPDRITQEGFASGLMWAAA